MKYGPGKYEGCGNYSLVAQHLSESTDEEIGSVDDLGWYGRYASKIKGHGPFYAVVSENGQGFVDVQYFDTEQELDAFWLNIKSDYEDYWEL